MALKFGIIGAMGAGLLVALGGCEKRDNSTVPATPPAQSPKPAPQAGDETPPAATDAKSAAADASAAAQNAAATPATTPAAAPTATGTTAADGEAQKMLSQAMTYIKENKYDLADKSLTQLEGMKASLSPTLQKGVEQGRAALTAAKAGGGIQLPPLGK